MGMMFYTLFIFSSAFSLNLSNGTLDGDCSKLKNEFSNHLNCIDSKKEQGLCSISLSCLTPELASISNKTFRQPGPNCFATALKASGLYDGFRAVSEKEFEAVIKETCVETTNPEFGDIGVYHVKNFGPIHAFMYVSKNLGFEKPGVDYLGQTPVRFNLLYNIDYVHRASKECRQHGDESCHNSFKFLRCEKLSLPEEFQAKLNVVNRLIDDVLNLSSVKSSAVFNIELAYQELAFRSTGSVIEKEILSSIGIQIKFFRQNLIKRSPKLF